ncbi:hypothetical protein HDU85_000058 [Gaertneriomyces sp. JEL0708]|nr:hypothetical protein HDU85_000058 [Gaertneriomyces sp. JEL0708]
MDSMSRSKANSTCSTLVDSEEERRQKSLSRERSRRSRRTESIHRRGSQPELHRGDRYEPREYNSSRRSRSVHSHQPRDRSSTRQDVDVACSSGEEDILTTLQTAYAGDLGTGVVSVPKGSVVMIQGGDEMEAYGDHRRSRSVMRRGTRGGEERSRSRSSYRKSGVRSQSRPRSTDRSGSPDDDFRDARTEHTIIDMRAPPTARTASRLYDEIDRDSVRHGHGSHNSRNRHSVRSVSRAGTRRSARYPDEYMRSGRSREPDDSMESDEIDAKRRSTRRSIPARPQSRSRKPYVELDIDEPARSRYREPSTPRPRSTHSRTSRRSTVREESDSEEAPYLPRTASRRPSSRSRDDRSRSVSRQARGSSDISARKYGREEDVEEDSKPLAAVALQAIQRGLAGNQLNAGRLEHDHYYRDSKSTYRSSGGRPVSVATEVMVID